MRAVLLISALTLIPSIATAQQPCTTDARRVVDEIYRHVLERAADPGSAGWVDRLSNGSMNVKEVVRGVAKSPEHLQRFTENNRDSVIATMYRHILGRQPDAAGQRQFVQLAERQGLPAVIDQLVNSPEYQQSFGDWGVPGSGGVNYCGTGAFSTQNQSRQLPGMRFRRLDTNNDGRVSRDEWRGNPQSFQAYDANNDGVLSGDEVSMNRRADAVEARTEDRFDYLDINGNGFVDRSEWDGGYDAFARLDLNNDSRLTRAEFDDMNTSRLSTFNSIDTNRDGRIALYEWPWSHRSFDQQDQNGDGVITRTEFRGAVSQR